MIEIKINSVEDKNSDQVAVMVACKVEKSNGNELDALMQTLDKIIAQLEKQDKKTTHK